MFYSLPLFALFFPSTQQAVKRNCKAGQHLRTWELNRNILYSMPTRK